MDLFKTIIDEYNDNSYDITFKGNVVFQFMQGGKFEEIHVDGDTLEVTQKDYTPVSVISPLPQNTSDKTGYISWQATLRFAVELDGDELDDNNDRYNAIVEVSNRIHSTQIGNIFVTANPPIMNGQYLKENSWFLMIDVGIILGHVENGMYGDGLEVYLDDVPLLWTSFTPTAGVNKQSSNSQDGTNVLHRPVQRNMSFSITIFYTGTEKEKELRDYVNGLGAFNKSFKLKYVYDGMEVEKDVFPYGGTMPFQVGGLVQTITTTLVEWGDMNE